MRVDEMRCRQSEKTPAMQPYQRMPTHLPHSSV